MSLKIAQGLFKFDFTDHYAVLGIPFDADFNDIRKRYTQIARRLHPDSCKAENEADKKLALQLLAKLVSPAYKTFSSERDRAEYGVLVNMMGKRVVQEGDKIQLKSEAAKKLSQANDLEPSYKKSIQELAAKQYESLGQALEITAALSELNLVYLLRKETKGEAVGKKTTAQTTSTPASAAAQAPATTPTPAAAAPPKKSRVEEYCRRAEELIGMKNFTSAKQELQEAIKIDPNDSRCHALLGMLYLKQVPPQTTMAKVHINKSLQLNPQDPTGLEAKKLLEKPAGKGKKDDKPSGGFFGNLFGGKKK